MLDMVIMLCVYLIVMAMLMTSVLFYLHMMMMMMALASCYLVIKLQKCLCPESKNLSDYILNSFYLN